MSKLPSRIDRGIPVKMPRPSAPPTRAAPSGGAMPRTTAQLPSGNDHGRPIKNPSAASPPGLGPKKITAPRMEVFVATRPPAPPQQSHISASVRAALKEQIPEIAKHVREVADSK